MTGIGGDGEIAAFEQLRGRKARPVAITAATAHPPAGQPDHVAVAMIGAAVAVLLNGAAELGDDDDDRVVPVATQAAGQRGQPIAERTQPVGELTLVVALLDMRVPAAE